MRKLILIGLLVLSGACQAEAAWTESKIITELLINPNYGSIFIKQSTMINPVPCQGVGYYELDSSNTMNKEIYSFLLSSYMAKRPVKIYVSSCTTSGYSRIDQVLGTE